MNLLLNFRSQFRHSLLRRYLSTPACQYDPLNVAFFGSGNFSVASLRKLLQLRSSSTKFINDLKVITRTIKPTGRSMKTFKELPVSEYALSNNIPILRADTSEEINRLINENNFNLTIAVSYGKLIPSKFLESCQYGGLNVHPSLLPKYSGSSPIQYALINDDKETGVTLQTLHATKFDHGSIISQSNPIEIQDSDNYKSLETKLGELGAQLLVNSIKDYTFLNPNSETPNVKRTLAPKIDKSKRQILWNQYIARQIKRLYDALGPLYTFIPVQIKRRDKPFEELKRVILNDVKEVADDATLKELNLSQIGEFCLLGDRLYIRANQGYVSADLLQLQTKSEESATQFMKNFKKNIGDSPQRFVESL
ncbi:FMT1 [Candida jiufengensis]|uniref:FMT1 n=1 Tax=Candida jiufengensis TaxID=497108 RepID=UPI0022257E88|nr:FMT1 [Candida jiufengensis]KAI5955056.1 FMT1 [Candida jiufengensis]